MTSLEIDISFLSNLLLRRREFFSFDHLCYVTNIQLSSFKLVQFDYHDTTRYLLQSLSLASSVYSIVNNLIVGKEASNLKIYVSQTNLPSCSSTPL